MDHFIPKYIDDPPQILWWDMDVAGVIIFSMIIGIAVNHLLYFSIGGLVAAYAVGKMKNSKQEGYIYHLAWWHGVPSFKIREMPDSYIREFTE
ncbi:MAG: type IV conjugative transfer system protein TraL [Deltaproteobacteria bacterium GWC2_56_8]|nr:MAG: type IV conjugative transfer system protein TraL [Deltaproteobacteria bacterium GWC2_56_8]